MNQPKQTEQVEGAMGYSMRKSYGGWQILLSGVVVREFLTEDVAQLFFKAWSAGRNPAPEQVAAALNGLWTKEVA